MKDLIEHANKLRKANGQAANLTIDSFADIVEAIHLVQEELHIAGTSENEAATTLEGSFKSMRAAWTNFLGSLSDKNEHPTLLVENLVDTIQTYWGNLGPAIDRFMSGFAAFITKIAPIVEEEIPKLISKVAPKVSLAAKKLLISVGKSLPSIAKTVLKEGINGVIDVANALLGTRIPKIKEIRFPTWDDVYTAATVAWDTIQYGFKSIAKLVLGDDFNADDSWIQVGSKIFEKIKSGVHGAGELIYKLLNPGADTSEMTPSQLWVGVGKSIWDTVIAGIADIAELIAMFINPDIDFTGLTPDQKWQLIGQTIWEGIKSGIGFIGDLIVGILAPDIDLSQFKADASKWGVIGNAIFTAIGNGTLKVFEFIASLLNPDIDFNSYTANTDKWGAVGDAIWKGILSGVKDIGVFINTLMNPEYDPTGLTAGQVWVDVGEAIIDGISDGVGATTDFISRLILGDGYTSGDPTKNWTEVGKKIREWIDGLFAAPQDGENGAEGLGTKLWKAIWDGITSGVTGAGDLLYGLLVGGEADASLTSAEKWQQIGTAILDGINLAFNGVTDFIYSLIVGTEVPATNQEKWAGIGTAIIEGIKSAFGMATDFLYGLIVGDGEAANSESKKWEGIGNAILNGIRTAFTSATDFLYSIIVGGETPATNPEKWKSIGTAILEGIESAVGSTTDFLLRLVLGDAYSGNFDADWIQVGKNIHEWVQKLFEPSDGGEETLGSKIWSAIWSGITSAAQGAGDLLLGLIVGPDSEVKSWADYGKQLWDNFTSNFQIPAGIKNFYNRFVDIINMMGGNMKHWNEGLSTDEVMADIEAEEGHIHGLVEVLTKLYETYGQSAQFTEQWQMALAQLETLVPGISKSFTDENGNIKINTELINQNIEAWKNLAIQKAINAGLEREGAELSQATADKLRADAKMNKARTDIEKFRAQAVDVANRFLNLGQNGKETVFGEGMGLEQAQSFLSALKDIDGADLKKFETLDGSFEKLLSAGSSEEFKEALSGFDFAGFLNSLDVRDIVNTTQLLFAGMEQFPKELFQKSGILDAFSALAQNKDFTTAVSNYKSALEELADAETRYNDAVTHYQEFYTAAQEALNKAQTSGSEATSTVTALGEELNKLPNEKIIRVVINEDGSLIDNPGHTAKGLNYVPVNDYLTRLHKGEAVLSANQAREWRNGVRSGLDTELIANAVKGAITEAMGNMAFVMNGKQVVNAIGGRMSKSMSGFQRADSAGYGR